MTDAPATNELLPCPFCGSERHTLMRGFRYLDGSSDKESAIRCPTCECRGLLKSWNTRAAATPSAQGASLLPDASPGNGAEKVSREDEARSLIEAERQRQIDDEGYDTSHDDEHKDGELLRAGMCYLNQALVSPYSVPVPPGKLPMGWPWANQYWKPKDARRNLVKGGALLLAERDRLRRAGRYHGHADHKIELAVRRLAALHSTSAAGETTSSDGGEPSTQVPEANAVDLASTSKQPESGAPSSPDGHTSEAIPAASGGKHNGHHLR